MTKTVLSIISFTTKGATLAASICMKIATDLPVYDAKSFSVKQDVQQDMVQTQYVENLKEWTKQQFAEHNAILFIGACGIAVRTIAPFLESKLTDSPVLVMDEAGQFVIPILSGHVGGANKIANELGHLMEMTPVITTATDVSNQLAIDVFAKNHDLSIGNKDGIAKVSYKVLEGKKLTLSIAPEYESKVDIIINNETDVVENYNTIEDQKTMENKVRKESLLTLIPREYILGIGCRKGKDPAELDEFINDCMLKAGITWKQIRAIATIDIKKEEPAILELARKQRRPLCIFDAKMLEKVPGEFETSEFVKSKVGVDNVCERAAIAACKVNGRLVQNKIAENGMTLAIAKEEWRLTLYEE